MRKGSSAALLFLAAILGACSGGTPTSIVTVPTLAVLPSETSTLTPTNTLTLTATLTPKPPTATDVSAAFTRSPQPSPTLDVPTLNPQSPTATPTLPASDTPPPTAAPPTPTPVPATETPGITVTPSLTITDTPTRTPSNTYTPSPDAGAFSGLLGLIASITIEPASTRYNPPTLTALAVAGAQNRTPRPAVQGGVFQNGTFIPATPAPQPGILGATPTPFSGGVPGVPGTPGVVVYPTSSVPCALPPPPVLASVQSLDPTLAPALGCSLASAPLPTAAASQTFERGIMLYVAGSPGQIYVLTNDSRFQAFVDTWVAGVDPETSPEAAPPGLGVPGRGFLKVWANNPAVRAALGYATGGEQGDTASLAPFEHGRLLYLPSRTSTVLLLASAPIGLTGTVAGGTYRVYAVSF